MRLASLPLERKLPLLITGLLVAVLAVALFSTWGMLSQAAEAAASERLTRAADGIALTAEDAIEDRTRQLRELADDSAFASAVRRGDRAMIARMLGRLKADRDSQPVELVDPAGAPVVSIGRPVTDSERAAPFAWIGLRSLARARRDTVLYSPIHARGGRTYFWALTPVVSGRERLGYIAQERRAAGAPGGATSLRGLLGEAVTLHLRNADFGYWSTAAPGIGGKPVRRDTTERGMRDVLPTGERLIVGEAPVQGTPWVFVVQAPVKSVLAPARWTLLRLSMLAVLLTAIGGIVARAISRRIVRPLSSLTVAAEAIAQGDYERRAKVEGDDEVRRLGAAFNKMADEVARGREALERRTREAEAARGDAERANRAKADFLAVMSHELRTPLNAIGGYTDLLSLGVYGAPSAEQREALARITRNQEHLLALINDILNFAKIDAGQVRFDLQDIPVQEVLIGIEPLIAPQLQAKRLQYESTMRDPDLTARADGEKLRQVLINLLTNAIKFTPAGGRITVTCAADGENAVIEVADTGPGIPKDRLATIFDPFVQADRSLSKPHEGVGLGLAISRDLARGMDGSLTVASEVGVGSVFTVTLPRSRPPHLAHARSQSTTASK